MNGWDIFTWLCSAALATSALVIFAYFVRDAGSILNREMRDTDEGPGSGGEEEASSSPTQEHEN